MFLYNIVIQTYFNLIRVASLWSSKAKLWINGRKGWKTQIQNWSFDERPIWIHSSSLGEFEQVRHFIETVKSQYPNIPIVLTFFSPSGYEIRKDYQKVDYISYLPRDTASNAKFFLKKINPRCVLFVKYDLWFNFIRECQTSQIPLFLISALFNPNQYFFKPWGKPFKNMLRGFDRIYVQDQASFQCLQENGITNAVIAGDTRVDRAYEIMQSAHPDPILVSFSEGNHIFIAGSNWPEDDDVIVPLIKQLDKSWKVILAPHDISDSSISRLTKRFADGSYCQFTSFQESDKTCQILILDTIGHLSSAYKIGHIAYIGGGFKKGIHNTLEPAAAGLPIIFGPNFASFKEALTFVDRKLAYPIKNEEQLLATFENIKERAKAKDFASTANIYLQEESGATTTVINDMIERKILN